MVATSAVYAIYPQRIVLSEVLETLAHGGFGKESICLMLAPSHPVAAMTRDANLRPFEFEAQAANAGLIGWLSEFGAVLIPTFGFFIRSREFFHALLLDEQSISPCGRSGTLVSLGFSDTDARRCEQRVRESGALLYVSCASQAQSQWALELMRSMGAEEAGLLGREPEELATTPHLKAAHAKVAVAMAAQAGTAA
ncbi:MAG TPA: hypothetical protein VMX38_11140 [Verrucomicrobiae bacterium]|jgi:hypothetical protein|nr:hypothetical protein [Verrucomicrobiae bacterium]